MSAFFLVLVDPVALEIRLLFLDFADYIVSLLLSFPYSLMYTLCFLQYLFGKSYMTTIVWACKL